MANNQCRLKNLKFKSFECHILSFEPESRVLVKWSLEPTSQNLKNLVYFIDRGESPEDLKQLNAKGIPSGGLCEYVDYEVRLKDTEKLYYYRVRAVELNDAHTVELQTFQTAPFIWEGTPDTVASYIIEEHLFAFREVYGMPALIFKKMKEGARCPECWDTVLKRVTKSTCTTCMGTGYLGGYYPFIEAWMDFNPDPKMTVISEFGERQPSQTDALFTNYPQLTSGDLIVELQSNRYWRISNVRNTEKNRTTILQVMRLDEINRSDVEYNIEVPVDVRLRLLDQLKKREALPEF